MGGRGRGKDSSGSGYGQVAICYKHGNELPGTRKWGRGRVVD